MGSIALLRPVARIMAVCFVVATVLFVGLALDVFVAPPNLPDAQNLVENILASLDHRAAIWPYDLVSSLLFATALALLVPFARILGAGAGEDGRSVLFVWGIGTAGVIGLVGQLIYIGARQVTVDIPYCDCGFKEQEVISQLWAMNLAQGAQSWLLNGTMVLAAIGVLVAGTVFGSGRMPSGLRTLGYALALVLVLSVVVGFLPVDAMIGSLLTALAAGILLPAWAVWAGERLGAPAAP